MIHFIFTEAYHLDPGDKLLIFIINKGNKGSSVHDNISSKNETKTAEIMSSSII